MLSEEGHLLGPVLSLKFTERKGLKLDWNFKGIQQAEPQISHVFILRNSNFQETKDFLHNYYLTTKFGDLIGISIPSTSNPKTRKIEWMERSALDYQDRFLKKKYLSDYPEEAIYQTMNAVKKMRGIVLVNILMDEEESREDQ